MKSISRPFSGKPTWVHKFAGGSRQKQSPWQIAAVSGTLQLGGISQRHMTDHSDHHSDSAGSRIAPKQDSARLCKVHHTGVLISRTQHSCLGKT